MQNSNAEFLHIIEKELSRYRQDPSEATLSSIYDYFALAQKWGRQINLTAHLGAHEYAQYHVVDNFLAFVAGRPLLESLLPGGRVADLGCGGGFTGIHWRLWDVADREYVLIDSDRKKINFCKQVIRELGLLQITAHQGRVEDLDLATIEQFDVAVSRATWDIPDFVLQASRLVRPGGLLVHFSSEEQVRRHSPTRTLSYPFGDALRYLSIFSI